MKGRERRCDERALVGGGERPPRPLAATHRDFPWTSVQPEPAASRAHTVTFGHTDWEQATARRRHDHDHLRDLDDTLADIKRHATNLRRRTQRLLGEVPAVT